MVTRLSSLPFFFFFNDTATTEIYTLSLHDALPICSRSGVSWMRWNRAEIACASVVAVSVFADRKSTRLNSSHSQISYAVFCLKKKKNTGDIVRGYYHYLTPRRSLPRRLCVARSICT